MHQPHDRLIEILRAQNDLGAISVGGSWPHGRQGAQRSLTNLLDDVGQT
jgi:hypothetical protein